MQEFPNNTGKLLGLMLMPLRIAMAMPFAMAATAQESSILRHLEFERAGQRTGADREDGGTTSAA